jgi:hypothetical protein
MPTCSAKDAYPSYLCQVKRSQNPLGFKYDFVQTTADLQAYFSVKTAKRSEACAAR